MNNHLFNFITIYGEKLGQRIDNFLRTYLKKKIPKNMIYQFIRKGKVRINKKKVKPSYKLTTGDVVCIPSYLQANTKSLQSFTKLNKIIKLDKEILYEDDYILILNKPPGIAVHSGSKTNLGIIEHLRFFRSNTPFLELVHRLDKNTSGILLIAKKLSALRFLHEQMRNNKIQKDYLALVRGQWKGPKLKIVSAPILKKKIYDGKYLVQVTERGKPAKTYFRVEERFTLATLVRVTPITGRTHQIRVHASYINHPIALDDRYGDNNFNKIIQRYGLKHLFLHATMIKFIHPQSKKNITINSPLNKFLYQCLVCLRLHSKLSVKMK